jgi:hypothetical protein
MKSTRKDSFMSSTIGSITARVRRGFADMSYAQRRVFENQTGIIVNERGGRRFTPARPRSSRHSMPGIPR